MNASVLRAGFLSSVQDLGRPGHRASGVSLGGALDPHALALANLLVGNEVAVAGIEATLGELLIGFHDERVVSWTGGDFLVQRGGDEIPVGHPALVQAGEELSLTAPRENGRAWLGISGGIEVPLMLGSRSTDLRSGFGGWAGRALRDGDGLPLGRPSAKSVAIATRLGRNRIGLWSGPTEWISPAPRHPFLRIVRGADWERFAAASLEAFVEYAFTVGSEVDRMGVRLAGPLLERTRKGELLSEAVVPGTIQVPPSGQPILLLGDCQTIGGYPKIAHVITVDLPAAVQLRPGDSVRFVEVSLAAAQQLFIQRERDVERFRIGLSLRTS